MKLFPNGESIAHRKIVKWGIDPTGNRLHVGHLVAIRFLKKMIEEHRDVVVVIGTRTAMIGDPSGTVKERPVIEEHIVRENADVLEIQVRKLLPEARIVSNERGSIETLLKAIGNFTVAELLDRAAFQGRGVRTNELLVPVLQAIDSVLIGAEVEVGGEDQEFNFSITRDLQKKWGQKPEVCVLFPIIRGTDGQKMSKSLGNCVFLDDGDLHGKIMSIPDDVMDEWLQLFTDEKPPEHPKARKEFLAEKIIGLIKP